MADIQKTDPLTGVRWPSGGRGSPRRQGQHFSYGSIPAEDPESTDLERQSADILLDIHGLDHDTLVPEVQRAIVNLMREIDRLKRKDAISEGRIAYLEQMVDQHPMMPVMNRRAILRELAAMAGGYGASAMGVSDQAVAVGTAVLLHLDNFEQLHRHQGLAVAEKAMIHLARQMAGAVRASDRVGALGGATLLIVMPLAQAAAVHHKIETFVSTVAARPLDLQQGQVKIQVTAAVVPVYANDLVEDILEDADGRLRGAWLRQE